MELHSALQDLNIALSGDVPDNVVDETSGIPPKSLMVIEQRFAFIKGLSEISYGLTDRL